MGALWCGEETNGPHNRILLHGVRMDKPERRQDLKNIIEKELKAFSKLLPADIVSNIEKKVSPQVERIINQSGYIKKSKYENLEKIINDLEKRITELEKN